MTIQEIMSVVETHNKLLNGKPVDGGEYHRALQMQNGMDAMLAEIRSLNKDVKRLEELVVRTLEERDHARRMATHYMAENSPISRESFARKFEWNCWDNFKKPCKKP